MDVKSREEIIKFAQKLNSTNLSPLRSGNIYLKAQNNKEEGFLITPSGKKYDSLKADDIVFVSLEGRYDKKGLQPSSEWRFHKDIYLKKAEAKAVVHAHSPHATAVSAHDKDIPAFHYMIALAGGDNIKCAKYATFGTQELSDNIITLAWSSFSPSSLSNPTKIFSNAVRGSNKEKCWNTIPTPKALASLGLFGEYSSFKNVILPLSGWSNP